MRVEKIVCDACGKDISPDDNGACYGESVCIPGAEWYEYVDLCGDCNKKLTQLIINFLPGRKPDWVDDDLVEERIKVRIEENK